MVSSIIKQSIDLRLKFETPPKLTASSEICVLCGMLCRKYNVPLPDLNSISTTEKLKEFTLASVLPKSDETDKLITLLSSSNKESEQISDEWIEVMQYGYDHV